MFQTIVDLNAKRQEEAGEACVEPLVFKAVDGGYEAFRAHGPGTWIDWSADETCPQANVANDTEAQHDAIAFCEWRESGEQGSGDVPPAPVEGASCQGRCGGSSQDGSCLCDAQCEQFGDCCGDNVAACG